VSFEEISDKLAIVGVGTSHFGRNTGLPALSLIVHAFKDALADAGLSKDDVDGLIPVAGVEYDLCAELLGLDLRYAAQYWAHGRFASTVIGQGGMACLAGMASYVACVFGISFRDGGGWGGEGDVEGQREGGGPHGETPHYGYTHPGAGSAIAFQAYLQQYGIKDEAGLGPLAVAFRQHAALNPNATAREPVTLAEYERSPLVIAPLRRLDFCQVNDGAVCVIVSTAERARDGRKAPVYISGMQGLGGGRQRWSMGRPGLPVGQQRAYKPESFGGQLVYRMAGVGPQDIQCLQIYDSFLPMVVFYLEEMGHCRPGEALEFVKGGRIALGGALPINTSGGHHSEGMLAGWNHQVEAVRQLRGEGGERQIPGVRYVQYIGNAGNSIIYRR